MKRLVSVFFLSLMVLCMAVPAGSRESADAEGEGDVVATPKSVAPYRPDSSDEIFFSSQEAAEGRVHVVPDASDFPEIVLQVMVVGPDGEAVEGLGEMDFSLTEQSSREAAATPRSLTGFEEIPGGAMGAGFALVIDVSRSMRRGLLADAKAAALEFIQLAAERDRAALLSFSDQAVEEVPMQRVAADYDNNGELDIAEAVTALRERQMTALYDGTASGLESLEGQAPPGAVIVFTDGKSNSDLDNSINDVIAKAGDAGVPLFMIGLGAHHSRDNLRQMAIDTGGRYYDNPAVSDMAAVYEEIVSGLEFPASYRLSYTSHNPVFDGSTRTVTVSADGWQGTGTYTVAYAPRIALDEQTRTLNQSSRPPGTALSISGTITDLDARMLGQSVSGSLFYRTTGAGSYEQTALDISDDADGTYPFAAEIPAAAVREPGIEYYLSVSDGSHSTFAPAAYATAPYTITVSDNRLPEIVHSPVNAAPAGAPVTIIAEISDPDGSIMEANLNYRGHRANGEAYEVAPMTETEGGSYSAEIPAEDVTVSGIDYYLSATDNTGGTASSGSAENPYFISVSDTNQPPVADAGEDRTAYSGDEVVLDGTGSSDPDPGDGLSFSWRQEGGPDVALSDADTARASFVAPEVEAEGTVFRFSLTVTDADGASATDSIRVLVSPRVPAAAFSWTPETPVEGEEIRFADTSSSPNGAITSRLWDFAGEGASTQAAPAYRFSEAGAYSVTLTVSDEAGLTDSITHIITVEPGGCPGGDCGSGGCFIGTSRSGAPAAPLSGVFAKTALVFSVIFLIFFFVLGKKMKPSAAALLLLMLFGVMLAAGPSRAGIRPESFHISPMVTGYMFDDRQNIDEGLLGGVGLGYNLTEHFGIELKLDANIGELDYNYRNPVTCQCEADGVDGFLTHMDMLYHFRPDKKLVPYLAAGAGWIGLNYDRFENEEAILANYGGGIKYFVSENVLLRGDVRHLYTLSDSYNNMAVSLGLTFQLGGVPEEKPEMTKAALGEVEEEEAPPEMEEPEPPAEEPPQEAVAAGGEEKKAPAMPEMSAVVVNFEYDQADIRPEFHDELVKVALFLKDHLEAGVIVEGHTDNIGGEAYNEALGRRRAESVKRYLTEEMLIDSERIAIESWGETRPVASNETAEGRRKNRRAVIRQIED